MCVCASYTWSLAIRVARKWQVHLQQICWWLLCTSHSLVFQLLAVRNTTVPAWWLQVLGGAEQVSNTKITFQFWVGEGKRWGKGVGERDSQGSGASTNSNQMATACRMGNKLHLSRLFGGPWQVFQQSLTAMISFKWEWLSPFGAVMLPMQKVDSVRSLLRFRKCHHSYSQKSQNWILGPKSFWFSKF